MPKAYTMGEMKQIVRYIAENKLYNEIRGRKMWMDFANTRLVARSWQSMKETFLKRILSDIHNPYYKLTVQQIESFRQGRDLDTPRLEIQTISSSSGIEEENQEKEEPNKSSPNENTRAGEDVICSTIDNRNRSSTETLVLEKYETTEEIQKILESGDETPSKKSLKDCIVFSQPLTPMLQGVIDDFTSDDEPPMQIVENPEEVEATQNLNENVGESKCNKSHLDKGNLQHTEKNDDLMNKNASDNENIKNKKNDDLMNKNASDNENIKNITKPKTVAVKSLKLNKTQKSKRKNRRATTDSDATSISDNHVSTDAKKKCVEESDKEVTKQKVNCSNGTPDSILPNNQEALQNNSNKINSNEDIAITITDSEGFDVHLPGKCNSNIIEKQTENQNNNLKSTTLDESNTQASKKNETAQDINPCLKSVSLYEEQFRMYSNSDSDDQSNTKCDNKYSNVVKPAATESVSFDEIVKKPDIIPNANDKQQDEPQRRNNHIKAANKVVLLQSHSDGESEVFEPPPKKVNKNIPVNKEKKSEAIASILGFTSEAPSRKRTTSHQRNSGHCRTGSRHSRHRAVEESLQSSNEYSTISDDDYSPPYKSRKYIKPKSYSIMSLPGEDGLFIIDGKKIYPIVRHFKNVRNFTALSEDKSDDSENDTAAYWKSKYIEEHKRLTEEKIRCEKMKRMLLTSGQQLQETLNQRENLQTVAISSGSEEVRSKEEKASRDNEDNNGKSNQTVKIKVNKDHEIELECKWMQLNPILEKMAHLFHKPLAPERSDSTRSTSGGVVISSGKSTPVLDPEVHEKVNKLESEIFKEIEERDKSTIETSPHENNVTQRKRGQVKNSSSPFTTSLQVNAEKSTNEPVEGNKEEEHSHKSDNKSDFKQTSPAINNTVKAQKPRRIGTRKNKTAANSVDGEKINVDQQNENTISKSDKESVKSNGETKSNEATNSKVLVESENISQEKNKATVDSADRNNAKDYQIVEPIENNTKNDLEVANIVSKRPIRSPKKSISNPKSPKLPSRSDNMSQKSGHRTKSRPSSRTEVEIPDDNDVLYKFASRKGRPPKADHSSSASYLTARPTSPESTSLNSVDSTLGYQDSDISPSIIVVKRKKKLSLSNPLFKERQLRNRIRRRSHPYLSVYDSSEIQNNLNISLKRSRSSSLATEIYRSDSYDLLMNKVRSSFRKLDKIDENIAYNELVASKLLTPGSVHNYKNLNMSKSNSNSSNISLPLSPALSIVENISVSKDSISNLEVSHPTINETLCNFDDITMKTDPNKYFISEIDVSMPLMEQDCEVQLKKKNAFEKQNRSKNAISDSLVHKISSVELGAESPSEALHVKLQKLLLESAKKVEELQAPHKENSKEVDPEPVKKNKRTRGKMSSTPLKKRTTRKSKGSLVEPILEEHTESCSQRGRQSCPPIINVIPCGDEDVPQNVAEPVKIRKARQKKDIIKVKIQRPKGKNHSLHPKKLRRPKSDSRLSTDATKESESGICLHLSDDSVDLIHNHSDTCLHVNECINDSSLEMVENNSDVISVSSSSYEDSRSYEENKCEKHGLPETFCCSAQNASHYLNAKQHINEADCQSTETVYHTPQSDGSINSLMTEDLSEDSPLQPRPKLSNWHLLSEEDTVTNCGDLNANENGTYIYSNLNQIFPVVCAVPDLSTITEKTESNSRRPTNDEKDITNSEEVTSLKSIFDTIF